MVKGITKQVIVVKGTDTKLFEQAIFLIKDSALSEGGITEEALLQEARMICRKTKEPMLFHHRIFWAAAGALVTCLIWSITCFL